MRKPLTVAEAKAQNLLAEKGIYTFSNGSEWEGWAEGNCMECRWYDWDAMGACAFEASVMFRAVSPALAVLFGWTEREHSPGWYDAPEQCAFFAQQRGDDDDTPPNTTPADPRQLVLLADPTEDAAIITHATAEAPMEVA